MSKKKVKNTAELRDLMIECIADIRSDKLDTGAANSISALAGRVLESARLDVEVSKLQQRFTGQPGGVAPLVLSK